ncbi:hypothetical protein VTN77DRAFT_9383 [Rasamsonia byssochlamydoides]|uniref:uncharacterized protein n=1 Tax=Rasamsonia byssochlamydoides TaxID=89139 RepID=UPI00374486EF
MEAVPLTLAHTHARNAVLETRKSNPVAASEEHDLAAGEFATAAQNCSDLYALRTLQLLEQEHKRLAAVLRAQHEHPASAAPAEPASPPPPASHPRTPDSAPSKTAPAPAPAADQQQHPPRLPGHNRSLQRDTSSIASNLASARGIPAHSRRGSPASATVSAQHAGAQMTESPGRAKTGDTRLRETHSYSTRDRSGRIGAALKQPWSPPPISPTEITSQQIVPPDAHEPERPRGRLVSDEPFQRFYSTFEGLISKLSAPLAFAGLPLGTDTSGQTELARQKSPAETKLDRHHATSDRSSLSAEPDVNQLFSRAALRAIRDVNGSMPGSAAESFYVVPTTGGTLSYAGILSRAEKEARQNSIDDGGDDDFVDARETPSSPEMLQSLSGTKGKAGRGPDKNNKTLEELQMENQALKHLSDTLSKRLHMWEVNAQSSSMALQQSLKAIHQQNTASPTASSAVPPSHAVIPGTAPGTAAETDRRIKELEEMVRRSEKELERVGRENEKLKAVLGRYRERWEKLKEGAKTRRNAEAAAAAAAGGNSPAGQGTATQQQEDDAPATPVETPKDVGGDDDADET